MTRRRQYLDGSVAEYIQVVLDQRHLRPAAGPRRQVAEVVDLALGRVGARDQLEVVCANQQDRVSERVGLAAVVQMMMTEPDVADLIRFQPKLRQFVAKRSWKAQSDRGVGRRRRVPYAHRQSSVPKQILGPVPHEIAADGQPARLAVELAGVGEAGHVPEVDAATVQTPQLHVGGRGMSDGGSQARRGERGGDDRSQLPLRAAANRLSVPAPFLSSLDSMSCFQPEAKVCSWRVSVGSRLHAFTAVRTSLFEMIGKSFPGG